MRNNARKAIAGIADQSVFSGTNFLLVVSVASSSTADQLGTFALGLATYMFGSAINRGATGDVLMIRFSANRDTVRAGAAQSVCVALVLGLVWGALTAVGAVAIPSASYRALLFSFAIGTPLLFAQDTYRYIAFAYRRPWLAFANDGSVAVVQVALLLIYRASGSALTPVAAIGIWIVASACGAVLGAITLSTLPRSNPWKWCVRHYKLSVRVGVDNVLAQLSLQGSLYVVGATSGVVAVAALRVAQTVFAPPSIVAQAFQSVLVPELVSIGARSRRRLIQALSMIAGALAVIGAVWGALALLLPESAGVTLFGETWDKARPLLVYLAVFQVIFGVTFALTIGLRVSNSAARLVRPRVISVVTYLVAIFVGSYVSGAIGAAVATMVSAPIQALILARFFFTAPASRGRHRTASLAFSDDAETAAEPAEPRR